MWFLGVDWGERHHDLCLLDQDGMVLAARRIVDGLAGVGELHALVATHVVDPAQVAVGIETDRGLLVGALLAGGFQVYAVNPYAVSRLRGRYGSSRAKSDRGDAKVLADLVRIDRHNHPRVAGDSSLAEAVKVLARAHQSLIWARQRHVNALRSALREFYPGALAALGAQLANPEALAVLELAPTPEQGRRLTRAAVRRALVAAGRRRNLQARVVTVHDALAAPQLAAPGPVQAAYREVVVALVAMLRCLNRQLTSLEQQLAARFGAHPDAAILRSLPGLGVVLGARVLGEFGDDPHRYATAKGRKAFAGTAPVTRSSGLRTVVIARAACNQRLVDACYLWAFAAISASPGARRCYDAHRARGAPPIIRRCGRWAIGWWGSCTAAWPAGSPTKSSWSGGRRASRLTTASGGCRGVQPPAILATWIARGPVVQVGAMPPGQGAGRRRWPSVRLAAEGGSRGQLVSEERLDRGHGKAGAIRLGWRRGHQMARVSMPGLGSGSLTGRSASRG